MDRKIILNLAISLDGYISDSDGGFDWIVGHNDADQDTKHQFDFSAFTKSCDTIVMGRKAYDHCPIDAIEDYTKKKFLVATSQTRENLPNVHFISGDIVNMIVDLKSKEGKDIWLFGGSGLTDAFLHADVIDEYIIGIIPSIRGKGIKLFTDSCPVMDLHLEESTVSDGIVILRYSKRKNTINSTM